jgi:hypothetical protein
MRNFGAADLRASEGVNMLVPLSGNR